jgi:hypothetical protein
MYIKFNDFINETFLYYSRELTDKLLLMDDPISSELMKLYSTDIGPDITFVDIEDDGMFSFISGKNANKYLSIDVTDNEIMPDEMPDVEDYSGVYSKSRNKIKPGKFVNKVLSGKFKDSEIESFVNKLKSGIEDGSEFKLVKGDEIKKWYYVKNYKEIKGILGNSCMKYSPDDYFEIYSDNPEVCRMLILIEDDKLLGRALVWKCKDNYGEDYTYMDRIYTIEDSDAIKFTKYAEDRNWLIYQLTKELTVKLKKHKFDYYPYMDTFKVLDDNGILYNKDGALNKNEIFLESTEGGYTEGGMVYSEYYDEYLDNDVSVWSVREQSFLDVDRSIELEEHGWVPNDAQYLLITVDDDYIIEDEGIYSEFLDGWIHCDDSISYVDWISRPSMWVNFDYTNDDNTDHIIEIDKVSEIMKTFDSDYNYDQFNKDLVVEDYMGNFIVEVSHVKTYETNIGVYMTKFDVGLLDDVEIINDESRIIMIDDYLEKIPNKYNKIIKSKCFYLLKKSKTKEYGQLDINFKDFDNSKQVEYLHNCIRRYYLCDEENKQEYSDKIKNDGLVFNFEFLQI